MKNQKTLLIILSLVIISFFISLFWEIAHSLLYNWNALPLQNDVYFYIQKILLSTLGDVMYIVIIFLTISIFKRKISWIYSPKKLDYIFIVILGLLFAVFIEIKANIFNLWSYNQYMPQLLGIGLTPLIQLAITSLLTLMILNKFICNKSK